VVDEVVVVVEVVVVDVGVVDVVVVVVLGVVVVLISALGNCLGCHVVMRAYELTWLSS
jgi:hypothetical protein